MVVNLQTINILQLYLVKRPRDEKEALAGPFKGIIASGWFTTSLAMKLFVCHYLSDVSSMASPGLDGLKWLHPVRGGDKLKVTATVKQTLRSRSKPDRGVVKTFLEVKNQNSGKIVKGWVKNNKKITIFR